MSQKFPIYRVEPAYRSIAITQSDSEGRFYKYWCNHPQLGSCLFKAAAPDGFTPEQRRLDWSEKTAAELGKLLELPVARTELAIGFDRERQMYIPGTLSANYIPSGGQAISGRRFLASVDPLYDVERFDGIDLYNVENILRHLQENFVGLPREWSPPIGIETGADLMLGYLIFDSWLSATDRHDENWELALLDDGYRLCPTFDHGDSLGVNLSDRERETRNFDQFKLTQSCWWNNSVIDGAVESLEITTADAFAIGATLRSDAAKIWQEKLAVITPEQIDGIFARIPDEIITPIMDEFARELLVYNQEKIIAIVPDPERFI
jgi:hypothetical protein